MESSRLEESVDAWIALHKVDRHSTAHDDLFWSDEAVYDLTAAKPNEALDFILAVLRRDES